MDAVVRDSRLVSIIERNDIVRSRLTRTLPCPKRASISNVRTDDAITKRLRRPAISAVPTLMMKCLCRFVPPNVVANVGFFSRSIKWCRADGAIDRLWYE
jgi:hypothetical protein